MKRERVLRFVFMRQWLLAFRAAAIISVIACFGMSEIVRAATLTGVKDIMSRQLAGVASNHEIRFVTPTGVDQSSDTITFTFASGFGLSSIVASDVLLTHGPATGFETSETVAASAASGVWGLAVAGQTLTLTAPTNAAVGEIAVNDLVIVRIGTAAGAGAHQITNSSAGNHPFSIGGTFGDTGAAILLVNSADSLTVSATVPVPPTPTPAPPPPPPPSGGGGVAPPPPPPPPAPAPAPAPAPTPAPTPTPTPTPTPSPAPSPSPSPSPSGGVGTGGGSASGGGGTSAGSGGGGGAIAPIIRNLRVTSVDERSGLLVWDTDLATASVIEYGIGTYTSRVEVLEYTRAHTFRLSGLTPDTTYQVQVTSRTNRGMTARGTASFRTTLDTTPPPSAPQLRAVGQDRQVALEWVNPSAGDFAEVVIVAREDRFASLPSEGRVVYTGSRQAVIDTGLEPGRDYFYTLFARDRSGNLSTGTIASARTLSSISTIPAPSASSTTPTPPAPSPRPPRIAGPVAHRLQPEWREGSGSFAFQVLPEGVFEAFSQQAVRVIIPAVIDGRGIRRAELSLGEAVYQLAPDGNGSLSMLLELPAEGRVSVTLEAEVDDDTVARSEAVFVIRPRATISAAEGGRALVGAEVRILSKQGAEWGLWDTRRSAQMNPFTTKEDGLYGFFLEPGMYRVLVRVEGLLSVEQDVNVGGNILAVDISLKAPSPLAQVLATTREILQSPQVQEVNKTIVTPTVAVVAVANVAAAASSASLFHYLYFLFTQPLLLIRRGKRKQWGVVYNALSKQPIDLAVVRLVDAGTGRVVQTRITDNQGRYSFFTKPGLYRVQVVKQGFVFPTAYLAQDRQDGDFVDLYHGEPVQVVHQAIVAVNIPIDPPEKVVEAPARMVAQRRWKVVQRFAAGIGVVASLVSVFISPGWLTGILFVVQVLTYALFARLAVPSKPKDWGIVYDGDSRKTLGQTVVRIFDKRFHKLLETQITDKQGKYAFFAGPNVYMVTAEKPGYESFKSGDIDLTKSKEGVVSEKIKLQRKNS